MILDIIVVINFHIAIIYVMHLFLKDEYGTAYKRRKSLHHEGFDLYNTTCNTLTYIIATICMNISIIIYLSYPLIQIEGIIANIVLAYLFIHYKKRWERLLWEVVLDGR